MRGDCLDLLFLIVAVLISRRDAKRWVCFALIGLISSIQRFQTAALGDSGLGFQSIAIYLCVSLMVDGMYLV